jgi:hypothetical protein
MMRWTRRVEPTRNSEEKNTWVILGTDGCRMDSYESGKGPAGVSSEHGVDLF